MVTRQLRQKVMISEDDVFSVPIDLGALSNNILIDVEGHENETLSEYIRYVDSQLNIDWEEL